MQYGYARVSTVEQDTHAQQDALRRAGVEQIHTETRSGGDSRRPVLRSLLDALCAQDVVVVYKLDRIARSLTDLLQIMQHIDQAGADFRSLTESIDTTSASGRLMLHILGAFAEFERELIRERTVIGMRSAMERGVRVGRPRALSLTVEHVAVERYQRGESYSAIARDLGCHLSSIKRAVRRDR